MKRCHHSSSLSVSCCLAVHFRAWRLYRSRPAAVCMHCCGMHQQFKGHHVDLSASSRAATNADPDLARLTDHSGGVSAHYRSQNSTLHRTKEWNSNEGISEMRISRTFCRGRERAAALGWPSEVVFTMQNIHLTHYTWPFVSRGRKINLLHLLPSWSFENVAGQRVCVYERGVFTTSCSVTERNEKDLQRETRHQYWLISFTWLTSSPIVKFRKYLNTNPVHSRWLAWWHQGRKSSKGGLFPYGAELYDS